MQAIVLLGAVLKFQKWGEVQPRFRDLARDLKTGFLELKNQINTIPLKKDKPKKDKEK